MTRSDTPPAIAFDLFFDLPSELRRYVLSRFVADSAAIGRMVEIAATIAGDRGAPRPRPDISPLVDALADGSTTEAARLLAAAAGLPVAAGQAILTDPGGEPFAIALKATGMSRKNFAACLEKLRAKAAPQFAVGRDRASLQRLFDSLSYNKAKVLLTYWSWRFGSSGV